MKKIFILYFLAASLHCYAAKEYSRYSIIIGKNEGGHGRPELRYATTDATSISGLLEEFGGVKNENNVLLLEPDKKTILSSLKKLDQSILNKKRKGAHVEFFFYYSGHSDDEGLLLKNDKLLYKSIKNIIKKLASDVNVVILDSCSSGSITKLKGGKSTPSFMFDESSKLKGHAFLTSSSSMESSQESETVKGSYFSHYLASGLRGAADNNSDGKVTLNEAYQYVFNETLAVTEKTEHGAQHPSYDIQIQGTGELVMTDLRKTSTKLILGSNVEGRLFIRDPRGFLVAEVNKLSGKKTEIALAPEKYSLTLQSGEQNKIAEVVMNKYKPVLLASHNFIPVRSEKTVARGPAVSDSEWAVLSSGLFMDEKIFSNIFIRGGYRYFYGIFNFGIGMGGSSGVYSTGVGLGARTHLYKFLVNGDITYSKISHPLLKPDGGLIQLRLMPTYRITDIFSVYLGGTINFYTNKINNSYNKTSNIIIRNGKGYRAGVFAGVEFNIL